MSLSTLSRPIKAFLQATASRDRAALLASFVNDAVLVDMGKEHRGDEIARWMDSLYLGSNVRVHPLHTEERDGRAVLAIAVDGDYAALRVTEPFQLDWHIDLAGDRIARLRMVEEKLDLPAPVLDFVQAMNMYDLDGMVSRFAPDAVANDQMRDYAGREAIRAWLAKEVAGDRVTTFVTEILRHPGGAGGYDLKRDDDTSAAEQRARLVPKGRVVTTFTSISSALIRDPASGEKPTVFTGTDDEDARATVIALAEEIGFEGVDAGHVDASRNIENLGLLVGRPAYGSGFGNRVTLRADVVP